VQEEDKKPETIEQPIAKVDPPAEKNPEEKAKPVVENDPLKQE
jgi:hypothetical protein